MNGAPSASASVPRRELVTLLAYLETGSHKAGAHRLGISEVTSRQRISLLCTRIRVRNAAQAIWHLRIELEAEQAEIRLHVRSATERPFERDLGRPDSRS